MRSRATRRRRSLFLFVGGWDDDVNIFKSRIVANTNAKPQHSSQQSVNPTRQEGLPLLSLQHTLNGMMTNDILSVIRSRGQYVLPLKLEHHLSESSLSLSLSRSLFPYLVAKRLQWPDFDESFTQCMAGEKASATAAASPAFTGVCHGNGNGVSIATSIPSLTENN